MIEPFIKRKLMLEKGETIALQFLFIETLKGFTIRGKNSCPFNTFPRQHKYSAAAS